MVYTRVEANSTNIARSFFPRETLIYSPRCSKKLGEVSSINANETEECLERQIRANIVRGHNTRSGT